MSFPLRKKKESFVLIEAKVTFVGAESLLVTVDKGPIGIFFVSSQFVTNGQFFTTKVILEHLKLSKKRKMKKKRLWLV